LFKGGDLAGSGAYIASMQYREKFGAGALIIERLCGRGISDCKEHVMMSENSEHDEGVEKIEKSNQTRYQALLHLHPMCG